MADAKKARTNKSGQKRKVAGGAARINQYATRVSSSLKKSVERVTKWAGKERDQPNQERLKTVAHMLNETVKLLDTVAGKAATLVEGGWKPPAVSIARFPNFSEGDAVRIRGEVSEYYKSFDQKALSNMKIGKSIINGKRTNYVMPGVGLVPKSHLEMVE